MRKSSRSAIPTTSTTGATPAIVATTARPRRVIAHAIWLVWMTSMTTGIGGVIRSTATYGSREWRQDGPPITWGTGLGSTRGDGHGSTMTAGDTRRSTTGAGRGSEGAGVGSRGRLRNGQYMRPRWWSLLAEAEARSTETLPGSRWDRAKCTFRRIPSVRR